MLQHTIDARFKRGRIGQICNAYRAPSNFILVGGADTSACCSNFRHVILRFAGSVQFSVNGQNQRGIFRHHQVFRVNLDPLARQFGNFFAQMPGIQHHAIADHR